MISPRRDPTLNSSLKQLRVKNSPTSTMEVCFQDTHNDTVDDGTPPLGEKSASSLQNDAKSSERWLLNAKLAMEVAIQSLSKAGVLAQRVQETAEDTVGKMVDARIGSEEGLLKKISQVSTVEEVVHIADKIHDDVAKSRDTPGYVEVLELQNRACQVQDAMQQSREDLNMARAKLNVPATATSANLSKQVTDVASNLSENITQPDTLVDAEDLLKGHVTKCDRASLAKIDGVPDKRRLSTEESPTHEAATVKAEDVLKKKDGAVVVDPPSMGKIDGIPQRAEENQIHEDSTVKAEDVLKKKDGAVVVDPSSLDKIDGIPQRRYSNM